MSNDEPGDGGGHRSDDSLPGSDEETDPVSPDANDPTVEGDADDPVSAVEGAGPTTGAAESTLASEEAYCSNCGSVISAEAEICPDCGVRQHSAGDEKNSAVSFVASLVIPGAGQVYNDQVVRGIAMFLGAGVMDLVIIFIAGILTVIVIGPLFLFLIPVVHVAVAYDAYTQAEKINRGEITP